LRPSNDHCFGISAPQGGTPDTRYVSHWLVYPMRTTHGIVQKNPFTMSKKLPRQQICLANWLPTFWKQQTLVGGAYRDRTDDLKLAKLALSQLS
jgi:hypothetical protein